MFELKRIGEFFRKAVVLVKIYSQVICSVKSGLPYKLTLVITNQCNSHCKTCLAWRNETVIQMQLADIEAAVLSFPGKLAWLHLTGGEPFVHPEIKKILSFIGSLNSSMLVSISSNGLEEEKIREVLFPLAENNRNKIFYLNLSLDGDEKDHDFIRGVEGGFTRTKHLIGYFDGLSRQYPLFSVGINSTISKFNIDNFYNFYNRASRGIRHINVNIADFSSSCYRNSEDLSFASADKVKLRILLEKILRTLPWYSAEFFIKRLYLKSMIRASCGIACPLPCSSYLDSVLLFYNGSLSPCFKLSQQKTTSRFNDLGKRFDECKSLMQGAAKSAECRDSCVLSCEKYLHIINSIVKLKINKILPLLLS